MADTPDILAKIKLNEELATVPDAELQWLVQQGTLKKYKAGTKLFTQGDPIDRLFLLLEGELALNLEQNGGVRTLSELGPGSIIGALPFSRAETAQAEGCFKKNSQVLEVAKAHFPDMICSQSKLTEALVHTMTSRVRDFTHHQQQTDKMAALGKLSAGLHHELNNPAAAIRRSSASLKQSLDHISHTLAELLQQDLLKNLPNGQAPQKFSMLEKASAEDELSDWLAQAGVDDPPTVAEKFIDLGFSKEKLEALTPGAAPDPKQLTFLSDWLELCRTSYDIYTASGRISELVGAVKAYSHMDRSPSRERAQVLDGIRSAATMLNHKLKRKGIQLHMPNTDLPEVCIFPGELNQVWTNLLDNAIDALPQNGEIKIEARQEAEEVKILIEDNGTGISTENQQKIFNPFFTTKKVGEGSGMGLDIVKKIIDRHNGHIAVQSEPGRTVFTVSLPITD